MGKKTPEEYVIQCACEYREAKNAKLAAMGGPPELQAAAETNRWKAERNLLYSVEIHLQKKSIKGD